jgi:hypothetical protein
VTNIPEPATEPDPIESNDWLGEKSGDTISGVVTVRETAHSDKYNRDFEILTIRNGDDEEKRLPCARQHLTQLVEKYDPQPGDGIAVTYFGRPDGFAFQYGMRVNKSAGPGEPTLSADEPDDEPPF